MFFTQRKEQNRLRKLARQATFSIMDNIEGNSTFDTHDSFTVALHYATSQEAQEIAKLLHNEHRIPCKWRNNAVIVKHNGRGRIIQ